jgi:hypothetical protein
MTCTADPLTLPAHQVITLPVDWAVPSTTIAMKTRRGCAVGYSPRTPRTPVNGAAVSACRQGQYRQPEAAPEAVAVMPSTDATNSRATRG